VAGTVNAGILAAASGTAALPSHTFTSDLASGLWQPATSTLAWSTAGTERMRINSSGNVGIGTTAPNATLAVNGNVRFSQGALTLQPEVSNSGPVIDFSTGNLQYTTNNCGSFQLNNLNDGGNYSFAVKGTLSATCSFTAYSDAGITALTVHLPPGHSATTAGKHTLYSIMVMGADAYFAWVPGY
jgi:hypothetical protein